MKFDPISKNLYTDKGQLIKKLNCPYKMDWEGMQEQSKSVRICTLCTHSIFDTGHLGEAELLEIVRTDPKACMKVDLNQRNLTIIRNGYTYQ
jgi:hypothetical protein